MRREAGAAGAGGRLALLRQQDLPVQGCGRRLSLGARVVEAGDRDGRSGDEPWHMLL